MRAWAALFAGAGLLLAVPGTAFAQPTTVGDSAEAWFSNGPLGSCSSPIGCPSVGPSAGYPANTLHVGVTAGQTTATTYVQPDLRDLPAGETAVGGTMTLPLATIAGNGNSNTSSAAIEACLATAPFTDGTQGSTNQPPTTDCTVHSAVKVGASQFTVALDPFLAAWNGGRPQYGIALLPDPSATKPTSDWQVAFNGRRLAGAPHISSRLTLSEPASSSDVFPAAAPPSSGTQPGPYPTTGLVPTGTAAASVPSSAIPASLPAVAAAPTVASPQAATAAPPAASPARNLVPAAARSNGFQYPEVMLLPLVFAAGLVFVLRLLTSDATPTKRPV